MTIIIALVIGFDLTEWIRGGYGWRWNYDPASLTRAIPVIVCAIIYALVGYNLLQRTTRPLVALVWAFMGTAILGFAVAYMQTGDAFYALFTRTASGLTTGPHWAAARIDWASGEWQDWTTVMETLGGHLGTSPPGLILLYGLLNDVSGHLPGSESLYFNLLAQQCHNFDMLRYSQGEWVSAWFGMLMPVWAALTVFPIYGIVNRLRIGDGRYAALWWALVPAVLSFAASWSTFYPFLSATAFYLLLIGLDSDGLRRGLGLFGAGIITGIALFSHFTFLPLLGMLGFYTLLRYWFYARGEVPFLHTIGAGIPVAIGILLPWIIFMLAGGDSPIDILRASFDYHLDLDRPYWFWVWFHVWDWVLWTGVMLGALWLVGLWQGWRTRNEKHASPPILALTLALTVFILTISGGTQGESGRIWLFLSPFVLVAALDGLNRIISDYAQRRQAFYVLTGAQILLTLVVAWSLNVIDTDLIAPPTAPQVATSTPLDVTFSASNGDTFRLIGWMGDTSRSSVAHEVVLNLQWQNGAQMNTPYWFGAFLVPPEGDPTEPIIWQPGTYLDLASADDIEAVEVFYPTTCWAQGAIIGDTVRLPIPENYPPGEWWVSLAVFGDNTGQEGRLQVNFPDGTSDLQVGLGPVRIDLRLNYADLSIFSSVLLSFCSVSRICSSVVGPWSSAGASSSSRFRRLIKRITMKITNATIKKLIIALMNKP